MGGAGIKSAPRTISAPASAKVAPTSSKVAPTSNKIAPTSSKLAPTSNKLAPTSNKIAPTSDKVAPTSSLKDALLAEIRSGKGFFYNTVVAQAQKIDVADDRVTFTFLPAHKALREQFDQSRAWLEAAAERLSGRKIVVSAVQAAADDGEPREPGAEGGRPGGAAEERSEGRSTVSTGVQALARCLPG